MKLEISASESENKAVVLIGSPHGGCCIRFWSLGISGSDVIVCSDLKNEDHEVVIRIETGRLNMKNSVLFFCLGVK